uniref:Uncharacterized protein n=1 Tax=Chromera velia CCMP2878 TaxID=1169474 RepID=A0A0G4FNF7_9ALVE|eukprot:Cvel_17852.t1-p1 / transcript=Cvel_17852.t1 / gene=Cvel_17852 / organism=Chromera_velia_CCMP2878 / gene_product=hypothetical protein / transcript_product=hypothetical protein / location=Cvel_scaffold1447:40591-42816(+) / protein_length=742 / sequence_SO=supercontig / SO=protein_coding / is_pseudo=false
MMEGCTLVICDADPFLKRVNPSEDDSAQRRTEQGAVLERNIEPHPQLDIRSDRGKSRLRRRMNKDGALIIDGCTGRFMASEVFLKYNGTAPRLGGGLGTAVAEEVARSSGAFCIKVSRDGAIFVFCGEARPQKWKGEDARLLKENYGGHLGIDLEKAKLHFQHELPENYQIVKEVGRGRFGCCFLVAKKPERLYTADCRNSEWLKHPLKPYLSLPPFPPQTEARAYSDEEYDQMRHKKLRNEEDDTSPQLVVKVVLGQLIDKPRRPAIFYKRSSGYTLALSFRAFPLSLDDLPFTLCILKHHHLRYKEVHGDLNPSNMYYFAKDVKAHDRNTLYPSTEEDGSITYTRTALQHHIVDVMINPEFQLSYKWEGGEDEKTWCIIDSDQGGTIASPKQIVSTYHHDPRNATWEVSDDLIGLLNCVVVRIVGPHGLKVDTAKGFCYSVSLDSLQGLYLRIKKLYEDIESDPSRGYPVPIPDPEKWKKPLEWQPVPGTSFLDELVGGGPMLRFVRPFTDAYSVLDSVSLTQPSCIAITSPVVPQQQTPVKVSAVLQPHTLATGLREWRVFERLRWQWRSTSEESEFLDTLTRLVSIAVERPPKGGTGDRSLGGWLVALVEKERKSGIPITVQDGGTLLDVLRQVGGLKVHSETFKSVITAFSVKTGSDRWESRLLDSLFQTLARSTVADRHMHSRTIRKTEGLCVPSVGLWLQPRSCCRVTLLPTVLRGWTGSLQLAGTTELSKARSG